MKYNTRFCPTVNGPLHLGHLYTILINQTEAYRTGGRFIIRYDDSQLGWQWMLANEEIDRYKQIMREDMNWLGIQVDAWSSQSALMPTVERLGEFLKFNLPHQLFADSTAAEVIGQQHTAYYPMVARQTIEHVMMDWLEGINWCIRGIDLLTEDCLYKYMQDFLELGRVRMTYIPRLVFEGDTVSKTAGKFKLCDFRAHGFDPKTLLLLLAKDCLNDPVDGWHVDNIKASPRLSSWSKEVLNDLPA